MKGSGGDNVKTLQQKLIDLGYLDDTADGRFGARTERALKEMQKVFPEPRFPSVLPGEVRIDAELRKVRLSLRGCRAFYNAFRVGVRHGHGYFGDSGSEHYVFDGFFFAVLLLSLSYILLLFADILTTYHQRILTLLICHRWRNDCFHHH